MAGLTKSSIRVAINEVYKKKVQENRSNIKTAADLLLWTATQRGHLETTRGDGRGHTAVEKNEGKLSCRLFYAQMEFLTFFSNMVRDVFSIFADAT